MKKFIKKKYLIPITVWMTCFLILFGYLEIRPPQNVHMISCGLDAVIPCLPLFIYPYLSWFPYICVCTCLAMKNLRDEDYVRSVLVLTTGMNLFLVISYVWPTGLNLREGILYDTEVLSGQLMKFVQTVDAPKSVFPSMHVYVTLVLQHTLELQKGKLNIWGVRIGRVLAAGIILSTMLIKQHSVVDVVGAVIMYILVAAVVFLVRENVQEKSLPKHRQLEKSGLQ